MKTYKDVYKLPVEDQYGWVYDQKENFVFQFLIEDEEKEKLILDVINGKQKLENKELAFIHKNGVIKTNRGEGIILIRGWGNLTGRLNLSDEEAANIQDTFAEFIVEQLNKRL